MAVLTLLLSSAAVAQDVSARASLVPGSSVSVGSTFVLQVEVTGVQRLDQNPTSPQLGGFARYIGSGSTSTLRTVNGQTSVSLILQFRYQALEQGTFDIPPVTLQAGGGSHATEPLTLTVTAQDQEAGVSGGTDSDLPGPDDLFLTTEVSSRTVQVGEPVVVSYRLWTHVDVVSYALTQLPELEGFWVEELPMPGGAQVETRTRNGEEYTTAVLRRIVVVPAGPGERTLDPLSIEARVRVQQRRSGQDPFDRLFGGGLFNTTVESVGLRSDAATLTVESLPPGAPEPFSGVVGSLEVTASLDRASVDADEAVTLTVRVEGAGNVRAVPEPTLDLPDDFEVFPPEVSESVEPSLAGLSGSKTFEYVLIPRAPGDRAIPPIRYGYFDAAAGEFRTAETPELPFTVTGTSSLSGPGVGARRGVAELRQDIRFIQLGPTALRPAAGGLAAHWAFWTLLLLPMAGVAGAAAVARHRERLEGDVAWARGRRAGRVARKRFAEAGRLAEGDDPRAFYAEVARALEGFVADSLNRSAAGMQRSDLRAALEARGVEGSLVDRTVGCLDHCDRQRFAPRGVDREEMTRFLDEASAIVSDLDRAVR
ncbi:BatD family protein [Gaopeijia maritima]|uniref:BatD family protein n=1 Tax=Gaopeijia maritima TaxID=3119007 RepID=A0ABU9E8R6_9BACT